MSLDLYLLHLKTGFKTKQTTELLDIMTVVG